MRTTLSLEGMTALLEGNLRNPAEVLGPHPVLYEGRKMLSVRAFLPDSQQAWIVDREHQAPRPMRRVHPAGLYEGLYPLDESTPLTQYQLLTDLGGTMKTLHDPYAFAPLLTDFDLHLFGEGKLLKALLAERQFEEITGLDVSTRTLERAADRLGLERLPQKQRDRIRLIQGSLNYRDRRLQGFDAAAVVEVIEHLDPPRLDAFARVLFEYARPGTVVVTTPNAEYNVRFENMPAGTLRHKDHRFEWTRAEFQNWSDGVVSRFGYQVRMVPIGPDDPQVGAPTQMAVFTR